MRIACWNIMQGGGTRLNGIVGSLAEHDPDVVVLAEYRSTRSAELREALAACGWGEVEATAPAGIGYGMLIGSRVPLERRAPQAEFRVAELLLEVEVAGLRIIALTVPSPAEEPARRLLWAALLDRVRAERESPLLAIGDLNAGRPFVDQPADRLSCAAQFAALEDLMVDAWRERNGGLREFSWFPRPRAGGREHAFVSPGLRDRVVSCRYSHQERAEGLSDHSILLLDLDLDLAGAPTPVSLAPAG